MQICEQAGHKPCLVRLQALCTTANLHPCYQQGTSSRVEPQPGFHSDDCWRPCSLDSCAFSVLDRCRQSLQNQCVGRLPSSRVASFPKETPNPRFEPHAGQIGSRDASDPKDQSPPRPSDYDQNSATYPQMTSAGAKWYGKSGSGRTAAFGASAIRQNHRLWAST